MDYIKQGNCMELLKEIPDKSIDMVLCDLPYGTTNCKWDSPIPLNDYVIINDKRHEKEEYILFQIKNNHVTYKEAEAMWKTKKHDGLWTHYKRIVKPNGAIVLFAQTPFDKALGSSNQKMLRYEWIWEKTQATGYYNAKKMPMKAHENILVFYKKLPTYHPQMSDGHEPVHTYTKYLDTQNKSEIYQKASCEVSGGGNTTRYPRSVITFPSDKQTSNLHPTQKPLALCEYLIKTYTNEGEIILDNCMGSGTTCVAALNTGRHYIGFEQEENYFNIAKERINKAKETLCEKDR